MDRHYLVLPHVGLAYAFVPKAANSSVRYLLAKHFDVTPNSERDIRPNQNKFWVRSPNAQADILSGPEFMERSRQTPIWCFTVVREPIARLYSAWNNKIIENGSELSSRLVAMGARSDMPFEEFVDCVVASDDATCDVHVRSQAAILCVKDRLVPHFVAKVETLDTDWATIQYHVRAITGERLPKLKSKNVRANVKPDIIKTLPQPVIDKVMMRYADDYRLFYPRRQQVWLAKKAK